MNDDRAENDAKIAYIDHIRAMHARKRVFGLIGIVAGVVLMGWGRFNAEAPSWALWAGVAVIAVSWLLFAYVIFSRTRYVRTHPFDRQAQ